MEPPRIQTASTELITTLWRPWGIPIVSVGRQFLPEDVEGLVVPGADRPRALVTWAVDGAEAEIVTLDAFEPGRGLGSLLLAEAERRCAAAGATTIRLMTTNDNLPALRFYLRRGYRLARVHLDAMDEVFRVKPERPHAGIDGVALRDLWELRKLLR
jgi:GNAT superfamily N-acetyltransferase